jgi:hypothetical protein
MRNKCAYCSLAKLVVVVERPCEGIAYIGQGARATTLSVTLPKSIWFSPVLPWVDDDDVSALSLSQLHDARVRSSKFNFLANLH